jgi:hypothetical protein
MARPAGFEPATPRLEIWCSILLSYGRSTSYSSTIKPCHTTVTTGVYDMASIRFRNGKFQVQVRRHPHPPISATFLSKVNAKAWARKIETQLDHGGMAPVIDPDLLLADLITRYRDEITPLKKGRETETYQLNRLIRDPVSRCRVADLSPSLFAQFRDRRVQQGVRATRYDLVLLQHILKLARLEWGIPLKDNPLKLVNVRHHINWNTWRPDLREDLAHLVQDIKRRICGIASAGFPSFSV